RIATDLTLRPVRSSAGVVLNFKVAVDRYAGGGKVTDFIRCTAWGKTAERICTYLTKGNMIAITGSLTTGDYVDRNGIRRFTTDIFVRDFYFTGDKFRKNKNEDEEDIYDDIDWDFVGE
ncbi:MAG: single-stranded DNA-binding protein, partial [Oscillospiraceae bacterium]|nr:single-stranded DNA-binding protein [Oscillospiraceae bacterium]